MCVCVRGSLFVRVVCACAWALVYAHWVLQLLEGVDHAYYSSSNGSVFSRQRFALDPMSELSTLIRKATRAMRDGDRFVSDSRGSNGVANTCIELVQHAERLLGQYKDLGRCINLGRCISSVSEAHCLLCQGLPSLRLHCEELKQACVKTDITCQPVSLLTYAVAMAGRATLASKIASFVGKGCGMPPTTCWRAVKPSRPSGLTLCMPPICLSMSLWTRSHWQYCAVILV